MGKISEIFNFNNIGGKIKNLAKWSCWIPLVSAIVLPFLIWISSWILYAFGELVENSNSTNNVVKNRK